MSWGTKGSDKPEALPSVSSKKTKDADGPVVDDTSRVQEDLDAVFKETVTRAITKVKLTEAPEKPTLDDQNRTFRTRFVASWMLSNGALALAIENINGWLNIDNPHLTEQEVETFETKVGTRQGKYFEFLLYSTFALAGIRFIGVGYPRSTSSRGYSLTHPLVSVLLD